VGIILISVLTETTFFIPHRVVYSWPSTSAYVRLIGGVISSEMLGEICGLLSVVIIAVETTGSGRDAYR
jgi:hypothetical protein